MRDAKRRESEWKKSSERRVPSWGGKMGAPMGTCLIRREGRARGAMSLHMAKVRSDNRGPEGAADERARRERDVTEPSHSFQKRVLEERTVL